MFLLKMSREWEHVVNSRSTGKWFSTHRGKKECNFQSNIVLTPSSLKANAFQIVAYIFFQKLDYTLFSGHQPRTRKLA